MPKFAFKWTAFVQYLVRYYISSYMYAHCVLQYYIWSLTTLYAHTSQIFLEAEKQKHIL